MADFSKSLQAFGLTDVGRKRKRNEDFFRYVTPTPNTPEVALGAFFVVADGIGGMGFGEEASATAVNALLTSYYDPQNTDPDPLSRLRTAMQVANNAVIAKAGELGRTLIGTTAAGIIVHPTQGVILFNVGDARVYRLQNNRLERLSRDQSVLEEQLAQGIITEEEAAQGRNMNVTAFIGQPGGVEAIYRHVSPSADDIFLICSDGLWDLVKEPEIINAISKNEPEAALTHLVTTVLERGAPDNVTGIIVRMNPFKKSIFAGISRVATILLAMAIMLGIAIGVVWVLSSNEQGSMTQSPDGTPADSIVILPLETEESPTPDEFASTQSVDETPDVVDPLQTTPDTESTPDIIVETTPDIAQVALVNTETPTSTVTPSPTSTATATATNTATTTSTFTPSPTNTATASATPTSTATHTATATHTLTPSPTASDTITPSPTASDTITPSPSATATPEPSNTPTSEPPTSTLDAEALTLVYPFTATARANLPPAEQTALSVRETVAAVIQQSTETAMAVFATETAVFPVTAAAQTLQAAQARVADILNVTATARAESTDAPDISAEITPPALPDIVLVASDDVILYDAPTSSANELLPLLINDALTIGGIHPNGRWLYVTNIDGISGWVDRFANGNLNCLVLSTPAEALLVVDPRFPDAPTDEVFGIHLIVSGDLTINVREYASLNERANVFTGLSPLQVARIDATNPNRTWLRVRFLNNRGQLIFGWVSAGLANDDSIRIIGDLSTAITIIPPDVPRPESTDEVPTEDVPTEDAPPPPEEPSEP